MKQKVVKIYKKIEIFAHEFPGVFFIIASCIILFISIQSYNIYTSFKENNFVNKAQYNSSCQFYEEDIALQEKITKDVWNIFLGKEYYSVKISCINDKTEITLIYSNLQNAYTYRNKNIENQVISLYNQVKEIYANYNLPEEEIIFYVEDSSNSDFIYFCVEYGKVSWTCHDKQTGWHEGNNLTSYN